MTRVAPWISRLRSEPGRKGSNRHQSPIGITLLFIAHHKSAPGVYQAVGDMVNSVTGETEVRWSKASCVDRRLGA